MIPNRICQRLSVTLITSGALALGLVSAAHAGDLSARADGTMAARGCKEALQSAWFERQRQLTEGDTDPSRALPTPRECRQMRSANDGDEGKRDQLAARNEGTDSGESARRQP